MTRRLFAICVMALAFLTVPLNGSMNCWFESYDPPVEHCDPPCGDVDYEVAVADFSDGSSITRVIRRCSLSGDILSCDRTAYCGANGCAAASSPGTLPC